MSDSFAFCDGYLEMFPFRESVCNGWDSNVPRYHLLALNL